MKLSPKQNRRLFPPKKNNYKYKDRHILQITETACFVVSPTLALAVRLWSGHADLTQVQPLDICSASKCGNLRPY